MHSQTMHGCISVIPIEIAYEVVPSLYLGSGVVQWLLLVRPNHDLYDSENE